MGAKPRIPGGKREQDANIAVFLNEESCPSPRPRIRKETTDSERKKLARR